jgi:type IV pilus assembly protein PilW
MKRPAMKGFSLIEMMTALAISSVLLLGSVTVFVSNDRASVLRNGTAELTETGRLAINTLSRDIRMAGYRDSDWMLGTIDDAVAVADRESELGGDTITVRYAAPRDCNFVLAPTGLVTNEYVVRDGNLECNGEPIVAGVEDMQIYLAQDTDGDDIANRILTPTENGASLVSVASMRIHLLVRSTTQNALLDQERYFFDRQMQDRQPDGRTRREFSVTVALRNQL